MSDKNSFLYQLVIYSVICSLSFSTLYGKNGIEKQDLNVTVFSVAQVTRWFHFLFCMFSKEQGKKRGKIVALHCFSVEIEYALRIV